MDFQGTTGWRQWRGGDGGLQQTQGQKEGWTSRKGGLEVWGRHEAQWAGEVGTEGSGDATMVEGPGCTRNGQKVRASLIGKSVAGVAGSASLSVANSIRGRTLIACLTLGKELWLIFSGDPAESAIRCHFGMNGSLHCNTQPEHAGALTLLIQWNGGDQLRLFQATAVPADAQKARHAVHASSNRDVCSAAFDEAAGVAALAAAPGDRIVSDALLDQSVLPGTGNP